VHRDVKPSNVLLTPDDHVYVSDFGLTKRALSVSGLTATGQLVGTIDYVAPEHIKGDAIDRRADVYSLGCMVVECLTGHAPYPRDLEVGVLWAHVEEEPPKVTEERPELPPEIDGVVAAAMAKDPDARAATAGEVAAGLRSALGSDSAAVVAPAQLPDDRGRSHGPLHVHGFPPGGVRTGGRILVRRVHGHGGAGPDRTRPGLGLAAAGTIRSTMSEHTERLEDLGKRIDAAKEFL
jgi:serine/threonine protein kinase